MQIVVISHGNLAKELVNSAGQIFGMQEDLEAINYSFDANPEYLKSKIESVIKKREKGEEILFLIDLFGGTPFNIASEYALSDETIGLLTGVNLPILLGAIGGKNQPLAELLEQLYHGGQESIRKLQLAKHS